MLTVYTKTLRSLFLSSQPGEQQKHLEDLCPPPFRILIGFAVLYKMQMLWQHSALTQAHRRAGVKAGSDNSAVIIT